LNHAEKYNRRDGSLRKNSKGKDLSKGMLYSNLTFKDRGLPDGTATPSPRSIPRLKGRVN
jgi:hypothetical protein